MSVYKCSTVSTQPAGSPKESLYSQKAQRNAKSLGCGRKDRHNQIVYHSYVIAEDKSLVL